ncbi:protein of unknown function [Magnetospirillum gryphiswaldense MSR-1 v2]|uniref:Uncharacterized protein n=1 Tax=Magnetospirillum gryphiswaldense (strain DSM 6361 / JCM 21280 / NBRC 15271 / MSR-1) TaxID=431944 RepID=V6F172_MAGGM|nr:protein of unknown function [Magnetospirillum gryphiswaldense MSR-1 v2]
MIRQKADAAPDQGGVGFLALVMQEHPISSIFNHRTKMSIFCTKYCPGRLRKIVIA